MGRFSEQRGARGLPPAPSSAAAARSRPSPAGSRATARRAGASTSINRSRAPRRRPRKGGSELDRDAVDQTREDGQPADPVRENVMEHHHQRAPASGKTGHQSGRPQRSAGRQPPGHRLGDHTQQRVLVAGRGATDRTAHDCRCRNEESSIHTGRPHPNGTSISRCRSRGMAVMRPVIASRTAATSTGGPGVEHQDGRHLHRRAGDVAHQLHHVGGARPLHAHPCISAHAADAATHCPTVDAEVSGP